MIIVSVILHIPEYSLCNNPYNNPCNNPYVSLYDPMNNPYVIPCNYQIEPNSGRVTYEQHDGLWYGG